MSEALHHSSLPEGPYKPVTAEDIRKLFKLGPLDKLGPTSQKIINKILTWSFALNQANAIIEQGHEFVDVENMNAIYEALDIHPGEVDSDQLKALIPPKGSPGAVVTTHHMGLADAVGAILIGKLRPDMRALGMNLMKVINHNVDRFFIGVDSYGKTDKTDEDRANERQQIEDQVMEAFRLGEIVISLAAGTTARRRSIREILTEEVSDEPWKEGIFRYVMKWNEENPDNQAPIIPVLVEGENSLLYQVVQIISKHISRLLYLWQALNKNGSVYPVQIGEAIQPDELRALLEKFKLKYDDENSEGDDLQREKYAYKSLAQEVRERTYALATKEIPLFRKLARKCFDNKTIPNLLGKITKRGTHYNKVSA